MPVRKIWPRTNVPGDTWVLTKLSMERGKHGRNISPGMRPFGYKADAGADATKAVRGSLSSCVKDRLAGSDERASSDLVSAKGLLRTQLSSLSP